MQAAAEEGAAAAADSEAVGGSDGPDLRARLLAIFQQFDLDGSGAISTKELSNVASALGMSLTEEQLRSIVEAADPSGNGRIEFEEFAHAITAPDGALAAASQPAASAGAPAAGATTALDLKSAIAASAFGAGGMSRARTRIEERMYRDADFPPVAASIHGAEGAGGGGGGKGDAVTLPTPHSWRRFTDLWPLEQLPPVGTPLSTVQQGPYLGDCWLLSPLAALAARQPSKLRELFSACTAEEAAEGRVRVRLCPHGWWREVEVDTLIPCDERGRALFCGTAGAGWAAIVEKAFAKLLGSYAALEGGRCIEALVDLTGGVCGQLKIETGSDAVMQLAANLRKWHDQKHLLCCTRRGYAADEENSAPHVPSNHAYAIVDVRKQEAVLLRDPAAVRADEADEEADGEVDERFGPPTFSADVWVPMEKFTTFFDKLLMCKALPDAKPVPALKPAAADIDAADPPAAPGGVEGGCWLQHKLRVPAIDGGLPTSPTWCSNPQWVLRCKTKGQLIIAFGQRPRRERRVLGLSVLRKGPQASARAWAEEPERLAARAGPALAREVVARFAATPGDLILVPWQYADRSAMGRAKAAAAAAAAADGEDASEDDGSRFTLRIWSDVPCTLEPLPPLRRAEAVGRWDGPPAVSGATAEQTDGGRWPAVSWALNPQYALCSGSGGPAMLLLQRLSDAGAGQAADGADDATDAAAESAAGREDPLATFDSDNALGVRVVHATATSPGGAPGGALHVVSGIDGNVRNVFGELLPDRVHPAIERSESDIDLHGLRGKQKATSKRAAAPTSDGVSAVGEEEGLGIAAAAAAGVSRAVVSSQAELEAELGFTSEREASGVLSLRAGTPLLLVPSLEVAGRSGRFRLTLLSETPLVLRRVTRGAHSVSFEGEWKGKALKGAAARDTAAGGCHLEPTWFRNPQYALTVGGGGGETSLKVVLRRPESVWEAPMQRSVVESMMGFYLLRAPSELNSKLPLQDKASVQPDILHESCFAPTLEVSCTIQLCAQTPTTLVLVPATFGAAQQGPFEVALASEEPLSWRELT